MTIYDPAAREMAKAFDEALDRFERLPVEQQIEHLKAAGILGPDGNLAPRYAGNWDGDEDELTTAAK